MPMPDPSTPEGMTRLLLNDVDESRLVFTYQDIAAFLALEGGSVKRAAAQAIETNADNELLASKVLSDHQVSTNGAAVADSLRKRAASLRAQADREEARVVEASDDGYFFGTATIVGGVDPHAWYL